MKSTSIVSETASSSSSSSMLTVRNLTANPISLVLAETLLEPAQHARPGGVLAAAMAWCLLGSPDHLLPDDEFGAAGAPAEQVSLSATIPPFASHLTSVCSPAGLINPARVRLTIGLGSARFTTTLPHLVTGRITGLENVGGGGGNETLQALYVPSEACLAIISPAAPTSWMVDLPDHLPLSAISIPGTHNSPTCHVALPSVRCQAVGVRAQLDNGIRYLDVRVSTAKHEPGPSPGSSPGHSLRLVHNFLSVALLRSHHLSDLLSDLYAFLDAHPSETIILSIKREGMAGGADADLSRKLREVYRTERPERWYTRAEIPTLGAARGRIVLLRRFVADMNNLETEGTVAVQTFAVGDKGDTGTTGTVSALEEKASSLELETEPPGWGTSGEAWPDNVEDGLVGGGHIRIQDLYRIKARPMIADKIRHVRAALERAAAQQHAALLRSRAGPEIATTPPPMFINFLSGSHLLNPACWPERIAAKVNPAILSYLCTRHGHAAGPEETGDGATGVMVIDWVGLGGDWDLVQCIVGLNARWRVQACP